MQTLPPNRRTPRNRNQQYDLDEYNEFQTFVKSVHPECFVRWTFRHGLWSEYAEIIHEETGTVIRQYSEFCVARRTALRIMQEFNRTIVQKYFVEVKDVGIDGWRMHLEKSELDADLLKREFRISGLPLETLRELCQ